MNKEKEGERRYNVTSNTPYFLLPVEETHSK